MTAMSTPWRRWAWPALKLLLAAAILIMVGRQFYRDLSSDKLREIELRLAWLVLSAALYLPALFLSAWYWYRLLWAFGERPTLFMVLRAYFLGHLGKYVPGKAWALLLRGNMVRGPQVRLGVAIIASFYEVLTTMAAGALVAASVFVVLPPEVPLLEWNPLWTGVLLLGLCGVPLLPGVFNRLVGRLAERFRQVDDFRLPQLRLGTLGLGLLATSVGWGLLGLSTWMMWQAVLPEPPELTAATWARFSAAVGLAYVAGFLALVVPSGVGVREYFLLHLLGFTGPETFVAAAVLLLRVVWTSAELLTAGMLLCCKPTIPSLSPDTPHRETAVATSEPPLS
jgi:uncharacterized membrane protein YbhN (UPF0104 family)